MHSLTLPQPETYLPTRSATHPSLVRLAQPRVAAAGGSQKREACFDSHLKVGGSAATAGWLAKILFAKMERLMGAGRPHLAVDFCRPNFANQCEDAAPMRAHIARFPLYFPLFLSPCTLLLLLCHCAHTY
jgi:hypothetical protein